MTTVSKAGRGVEQERFERGGHDHDAQGFNVRGIVGFGQTLIPMTIIIALFVGGSMLWSTIRPMKKITDDSSAE